MSDLYVASAEFAFGADLAGDPAGWPFVDMADPSTLADLPPGARGRLRTATPVSIRVGRQNEGALVQPSSTTLQLDNSDHALSPRHPTGRWYPNVKRNTPARVNVDAGSPLLVVSGGANSRAGTPDTANLRITGSQTLAWVLYPPIFLPPAGFSYEIVGRFNVTGNNRAILAYIGSDGLLKLRWSTDGTAGGELNGIGTVPFPILPWGPLTQAVHLNVNNGAGGRTTTFYALAGDMDDWLADPAAAAYDSDTDSGTTSVFAGQAPLDVGDVTGSGFMSYPGRVGRVRYVAGAPTSSDVRADIDFTALAPGATSGTDATGKVWTVQGDAQVSNRQPRLVGHTMWRLGWPGQKVSGLATTTARVDGTLRRLRQGKKALDSPIYRLVTSKKNADKVIAYWPSEDGRDATSAFSPIPGVAPMRMFLPKAADGTLAGSRPLPSVTGGGVAAWHGDVPPHTLSGNWAVDWFFRIPTGAAILADGLIMVIRTTADEAREYRISVDSDEWRVQTVTTAGAVTTSTTSSDPSFYTAWGLLRLEAEQNGGNIDWNMHWVPLGSGGTIFFSGSLAGTLGRVTQLANLAVAPPDGMSVGHMIVSRDTTIGWLAPADTGFTGETAARRALRLASEHDTSMIVIGDPDDSEPMGPQRALPLPQLFDECAAADLSVLGEQRYNSGLFFRTRASLYNQQPAMIIDAGLDNPFEPTEDDQLLHNDITVTRVNGSSARAVDQDAIDDSELGEGLYDQSVTLNLADDDRLAGHAAWRLSMGTWPEMRYPSIPVLLKSREQVDAWVNTGLGDLIRIVNLPAEHPTSTVDLILDGYTERITPARWDVVMNCSPAGPWTVGVLDDDTPTTTLASLESDGTTLTAGIDDNDLSISATVTGKVWTTAAAQFPLDIEIGGEVITLSGISGASSPQTFTVAARSVNGVVKSHSAGAPITAAAPFRLAL